MHAALELRVLSLSARSALSSLPTVADLALPQVFWSSSDGTSSAAVGVNMIAKHLKDVSDRAPRNGDIDIWKHIFGECIRWEPRRNLVRQALGADVGLRSWDLTYCILSVHPHSDGYATCLNFMDEVVKAADAFWATSAHSDV